MEAPNPTSPAVTDYPATHLTIAGLHCTIHGLTNPSTTTPSPSPITIISLLHPRLEAQSYMSPIAAHILSQLPAGTALTLSLDHRNHGTRLADAAQNNAWRQGNPTHAVDMFSTYQGTTSDLTQVLDYLPSYLFPRGERRIGRCVVVGVSLGGHSAWLSLLHDAKVSAAAVVIGCADYCALMQDRGVKSRIPDFAVGDCASFPGSLLEVVKQWDPAAIGKEEVVRRLKGKKVLVLSGGGDKLVPYRCSEEVLEWLKAGGVGVRDVVYEGVGHECTTAMVEELGRWVRTVVVGEDAGKL
jgi:dienelactone hydrolase